MDEKGKHKVTAIYAAVMPEHLIPGHPINEEMLIHIRDTNCKTCWRFREWHLNDKYKNLRKKPKMPSCRVSIDSIKRFLNAESRAQHKRTAFL